MDGTMVNAQHADPAVESLVASAADSGFSRREVGTYFETFVDICRRCAVLEKLVLGSVPLQFPAYLLEGDSGETDPLAQGLDLARRERERLNLGHGAVEDLRGLIESHGLKVVDLVLPAEIPIMGAFVFDPGFGPGILVNAVASKRARDYALAHEYGHFLADYNPYRTRVCSRGRAGDSAEETRAHAFAGAFLVPGVDLDEFLLASGLQKGDPVTPDLLRQLRTYFEADDRAIVGRLLASGWLDRGKISTLMRSVRDDPAPEPASPPGTISPRLVGLAVMAFRKGHITLAQMAGHLNVDQATARRIERSFSLEG
jgi:Zn-dependent peptidase ImmA (M78 family)